jgi:peptidoglycan/LPS O-acetylase OafA/YrhL
MRHRADIDGLRAISIALVLCFHLGLAAFPGAFVGVDVFFVISGYLITGILLNAMESGRYSVLWFYERRIRRIVPALLVVIACCLAAGYILLLPGDYAQTARSGLSALAAASNIFFLFNTGYFDAPAESMPLLHTWSLGVEEQFYLIWPFLLALLFRVRRSRLSLAIGIGLVILLSFAVNLWQVRVAPKPAFFLPDTRAFELAAGAMLVMAPPLRGGPWFRWMAQALPVFGLAFIALATFLLDAKAPYPGEAALLPVLGACCIVYDSGRRTIGSRILGLPPLSGLGAISYSVYLWHWPLIVFWRIYSGATAPGLAAGTAIVVASIAAGALSWKFVEQPFRRPTMTRRQLIARVAAIACVIFCAGLTVSVTAGLPGRFPEQAQALANRDVMWTWPCPEAVSLGLVSFGGSQPVMASCSVGAPWASAKGHAIIWGDSNAEHFLPLLNWAGRQDGVAIALVNPCPAIVRAGGVERYWPTIPDYSEQCGRMRSSVLDLLRRDPSIGLVLLSARWSNLPDVLDRRDGEPRTRINGLALLREGLEELLPEVPHGRRVVLVNDIPGIPPPDPAVCALARIGPPRRGCDGDMGVIVRRFLDSYQAPVHNILREIARERPGVVAYSPEDYLCDPVRCQTSLNGQFLYRDDVHFRRNLPASDLAAVADALHIRDIVRLALPPASTAQARGL